MSSSSSCGTSATSSPAFAAARSSAEARRARLESVEAKPGGPFSSASVGDAAEPSWSTRTRSLRGRLEPRPRAHQGRCWTRAVPPPAARRAGSGAMSDEEDVGEGRRSSARSYTIRSEAPPEHTRAVAAYVDRAIRQIMSSGAVSRPIAPPSSPRCRSPTSCFASARRTSRLDDVDAGRSAPRCDAGCRRRSGGDGSRVA